MIINGERLMGPLIGLGVNDVQRSFGNQVLESVGLLQ